jgi:DHA1 family bicyclomycin/chloramphenicol resistance-like MFS transporter
VAPVDAPVLGGSMVVPFGWQAIFLFLTVFAGLCLFNLGESLPSSRTAKDVVGKRPANFA